MFQLPPTPKTQWAIEALTLDYLIGGTIDADRNKLRFQIVGGVFDDILFTSARIQPTGNLAAPDNLAAPWAIAYGDSLVAIIPRDQASLDYAMRQQADWRSPQRAEVYVGHYLIRGTLLSPDAQVRVFAAYTTGFVAQQVQVTSLLPGARLTGFTAPYMLVVGRHKHFVRPLA